MAEIQILTVVDCGAYELRNINSAQTVNLASLEFDSFDMSPTATFDGLRINVSVSESALFR